MSANDFIYKQFKNFGFEQYDPKAVKLALSKLPFADDRDFALIDFLFVELAAILEERPSEYVYKIANAYGNFCLAFWQSKTAFVAFPQNYAVLLKDALEGKIDIYSDKIRAIIELLDSASGAGICGFNAFKFKDVKTLREANDIVFNGKYEDFLSDLGKVKYEEFEKKILSSKEFKANWALIKKLYPNQVKTRDKLRRKLIFERGWDTSGGASFENEEAEFEAIYELFC
ncbi:MAG: hypothetical protein R3Y46_03670 [Opitutales bacterium]